MAGGDAPVIIKKVKKGGGGGGHHGGAWKVAYADFVTAMMAFFLLMWLINTTSPEQKRGIADYFAPASVSPTTSGSGGILAGNALGEDGVRDRGTSSVVNRLSERAPSPERIETEIRARFDFQLAGQPSNDDLEAAEQAAMARRDDMELRTAEMSLRQALQDLPELAELSKHVIIEMTPEGLRIQLIDQEGRPMFAPGSAEPLARARTLLRAVADVVEPLPNRVTIAGHTDPSPSYDVTYSNWDLSADRAQSARRIIQAVGLRDDRIYQVAGKGASEPLFPDDPFLPGNRRVSIVILREAPVAPPDFEL